MDLRTKINQDLKQALRDRDAFMVSTLRMLEGALVNAEIALRPFYAKASKGKPQKRKLTEEEILKVLSREIKKHKDSIKAFEKGNREDLVLKEKQELEILEKYLPKQLAEDEIKKIIQKAIKKMGEVYEKDFGRVMGEVMTEIKGRAEGGVVSRLVRESIKALKH